MILLSVEMKSKKNKAIISNWEDLIINSHGLSNKEATNKIKYHNNHGMRYFSQTCYFLDKKKSKKEKVIAIG